MKKYGLNDEWTLFFPGYPAVKTAVPTSVYTALLENGLIEDPHYGTNEEQAKELSRKNAIYRRTFTLDADTLEREHLRLCFECIDTIAKVYLNGVHVGNADSMFCAFNYDIKAAAKEGENLLEVHIASPVEYMEKEQNAYRLWQQPPEMTMDGYGHIRKAHCMFGWDWGPKLPDMGIYRRVELLAYDDFALEHVQVLQDHRADGTVLLTIKAEFSDGLPHAANAELYAPNGKLEAKINIQDSIGEMTVAVPQLWWPNGYGAQPLYRLIVQTENGRLMEEKIGLRTIWVNTNKDRWGSEFCFVVNGKKIFAMGADYIPEDNLIPRVTAERSRSLLQACVDANFNCIRVWGGGYYPDDRFYDTCDELGLIVWQDFMFACAVYNVTDTFEECIVREFTHNIKRLRNHASLGLFCGNNEMELAWVEWDIDPNEKIRQDYIYLFERLLPRIVKGLAPQTFYWPASPSSGGGFDHPNADNRGDAHYWEVWHGSAPFEEYRKHYFRFCSEFGFESFPHMKTLEAFARPEDMNPFSYVMESHQKCAGGNKKILAYLADHYLYPKDFDMFVYASQLLQADAIRYGVEHFRRFRIRCMGAIYWQLNDIWPGPSWSSVDCFGRWKALHHAAKCFFAPLLLNAHADDEGKSVVLNISNETMHEATGRVVFGICNNDFESLYQKEYSYHIPALSSRDLTCESLEDLDDAQRRRCYLYYRLYDAEGVLLSDKSMLLVPAKHYQFSTPTFCTAIKRVGDETVLDISSDCYTKSVRVAFGEITAYPRENYFDLTGPETKRIRLDIPEDVPLSADELEEALTLVSVVDIG